MDVPASVNFAASEGLMHVRESGWLEAEEFARTVARIREVHLETGCTRVLVDARRQTSQTEGFEAYNRGELVAQKLVGTGVHIAVVVGQKLLAGHEFLATVSSNRGIKLQVFTDEAAARRWLTS